MTREDSLDQPFDFGPDMIDHYSTEEDWNADDCERCGLIYNPRYARTIHCRGGVLLVCPACYQFYLTLLDAGLLSRESANTV